MANSYLDKAGLGILWNKIKALIPQPTTTSSENPKMDGTAAIGSSSKYARADHVHPSDTSRVPTTRKINGQALSNDITLTAGDIKDSGGANLDDVLDQLATDIGDAVQGVKINGTELTKDSVNRVDIPVMTAATTTAAGKTGLVPAPPKPYTGSTKPIYDILTSVGWSELMVQVYQHNNKYQLALDVGAEIANVLVEIKPATDTLAGLLLPAEKTKLSKLTFDANDKLPTSILPITFDGTGKISSASLPSYVDDVIEGYPRSGKTISDSDWLATGSATGTAITPETGKIYILMAASGDYGVNSQFRWGGSTYVEITNSSGISAITETEINQICV